MASFDVHLRPIIDADQAFLRTLYGTTRADEVAMLPWDQAVIETFLEQQFQAQHAHYQTHYAAADFSIVEIAGEAIGRAYLLWADSHLQIIDTALMPAWRGRGIGSGLIRQWLAQADRQGLSVGLHVTLHNPALRLYQRNGFEVVGDNGLYLEMRRPALTVFHVDRPA